MATTLTRPTPTKPSTVASPADADLVIARCECGGYLAYGPQRHYRHVNTCAEELHRPDLPCPDHGTTHLTCTEAEPRRCEHPHCRVVADPLARCDYGHELCCGCCGDQS